MIWDHSTKPPTAWVIEDGIFFKVDPHNIELCQVCKKWFVKNPMESKVLCSPGCTLKKIEAKNSKSK